MRPKSVNLPAVIGVANEQLRSAIPPSGYVIRVYFARFSQSSREAEITQLNDARRTNKNVFWFNIAVDDLRHNKNITTVYCFYTTMNMLIRIRRHYRR